MHIYQEFGFSLESSFIRHIFGSMLFTWPAFAGQQMLGDSTNRNYKYCGKH